MGARSFDEDPLAFLTLPPPDETLEQRAIREHKEAEAKKISEQIDEFLNQEKNVLRKKKPVKVLLLGQSESGKSTTLKNFQLRFSPKSWKQERLVWTSVIQLNLVRNVTTILDILQHEMTKATAEPSKQPMDEKPLEFTEKHRLLKLRLMPVREVQKDLERKLGSGAFEEVAPSAYSSLEFSAASEFNESTSELDEPRRRDPHEFYIRSNNSWKDRVRPGAGLKHERFKQREEIAGLIAGCKEDMNAVWEDPIIQQMLRRRKFRLEDSPGFFLNDVDRIAARDYAPSDNDVVRARLRTLGVQEYRFTFEEGHLAGSDWHIFDVGGARSSRTAWAPFFDDVDAIIFLAPLNCFDERLLEDPRVNRLQDSYELWKSVVSNKFLRETQIILFLNKYDLLQKKLERGVKVKNYVPSYGNRENTSEAVIKYFEQHFKEAFKKCSSQSRQFYHHVTSVVDTEATRTTLGVVEDSILREHLKHADLL